MSDDAPRELRVTVWNEFHHERRDPAVARIYPDGIHGALASALQARLPASCTVVTRTMDDPDCGLDAVTLETTDVLVYWGHWRHDDVPDPAAARVRDHVLRGMGFVPLHASARSKAFRALVGTTCTFRWREGDDRELVWVIDPDHPVAAGLGPVVIVPQHEMYGEPFDIPPPDDLVFISSFSGGEVFRSGCGYRRGAGRIFYCSLGHQEQPIYHQAEVGDILANAVRWVAPSVPRSPLPDSFHAPAGWFENGGAA